MSIIILLNGTRIFDRLGYINCISSNPRLSLSTEGLFELSAPFTSRLFVFSFSLFNAQIYIYLALKMKRKQHEQT